MININFALKAILAFTLAVFFVVFSYFFLDQPIALWADSCHFFKHPLLKLMTKIAEGISLLFLCFFFMIFSQDLVKPKTYRHISLCIIGLFLPVTVLFKDCLKIFFGRYWPVTWIENNPSFIGSQEYGFHWFHRGLAYESFPSGHATITFYVMSVLWILIPKMRPLAVIFCFMQGVSLIAMNYHFLGDVLSGAFLGSICAIFAVKIASFPPLHVFLTRKKTKI